MCSAFFSSLISISSTTKRLIMRAQQIPQADPENQAENLPHLSFKWFCLTCSLAILAFMTFLLNFFYRLVTNLIDKEAKEILLKEFIQKVDAFSHIQNLMTQNSTQK